MDTYIVFDETRQDWISSASKLPSGERELKFATAVVKAETFTYELACELTKVGTNRTMFLYSEDHE